jgi:hypothetical protein
MNCLKMKKCCSVLVCGVVFLFVNTGVDCFQPTSLRLQQHGSFHLSQICRLNNRFPSPSKLFVLEDEENGVHAKCQPLSKKSFDATKKVPSIAKNHFLRSTKIAIRFAFLTFYTTLAIPFAADASAPVMALPKAEGRDPASEALMEYERRQIAKTQQELNEMTIEARKIEAEQGEAARIKFENEYKDRQQKFADERAAGLIELKQRLLEQGICPFVDLEGQRQVVLYTRNVDLGTVPGTQFYLEKEYEKNAPKRSMAYKKATNRKVIACMVQDMKNRGIDPIDYFERHEDQTDAILDLPAERAANLVRQYEKNLEEYGQILPPKEGELSVKEKLALVPVVIDPAVAKAEEQRVKLEEKAKLKALKEQEKSEKARLVDEAKAEKIRLTAEKKNQKKIAKEKAKEAAAIATMEINQIVEEKINQLVQDSVSAAIGSDELLSAESLKDSVSSIVEQIDGSGDNVNNGLITIKKDPLNSETALQKKITLAGREMPSVAVGGVATVVVGSGSVVFKLYRDKSIRDEDERKRQLRLLMGAGKDASSITPSPAPALEVEMDLEVTSKEAKKKTAEPIPDPALPVAKKRRLGIKNVFSKKKNGRETDLMMLVGNDAEAPEFTKTLAKILTFGAMGRFPSVVKLPGGMPMEKFELDEAKKILIDSQIKAGLSLEESAEIFADVVNCMLIDIVDLASASLKEKDEKVTVEGINVVIDFMNHAASLYDSIAEGVTITPVTYGGALSKAKLEQMYSSYAVSGMMNMDKMTEDFDSRVAMLQDVFQINEKKAEGLMMKAMQKNMMNMLKNGEGMEGMEEMMKSMGGLDGMPPGLGGMDGDGPSPEQLKEMLKNLKDMKDSGAIPPDEFDKVKEQFKEAFGSSIDDVVKEANVSNDELSKTDKELLELMKSIMQD